MLVFDEYRKLKGKIHRDPAELSDKMIVDLVKFRKMVQESKNFTIVKFGDGEWNNVLAEEEHHSNCDGNHYFRGLGNDLMTAYAFFLQKENAYICRWHHIIYGAQDALDKKYLLGNPDDKFIFYDILIQRVPFPKEQIDFFKEIKNSSRKKIYVSNIAMITAVVPFLNIDVGIVIPTIDCYLHREEIIKLITEKCDQENCIVLFSAGMAAKVLIAEVYQRCPNNTFIDIGSTFDGLIKRSRDYNSIDNFREMLLNCYKD